MHNKIKKYSWIHELNRAALDAKCLSEIKILNESKSRKKPLQSGKGLILPTDVTPEEWRAERGTDVGRDYSISGEDNPNMGLVGPDLPGVGKARKKDIADFFGKMTPTVYTGPNDPNVTVGPQGPSLGSGQFDKRPTVISPSEPNPNAAARITDPTKTSSLFSQMKPPPPRKKVAVPELPETKKRERSGRVSRKEIYGVGERAADSVFGKATTDRDVVLTHLRSLQGAGSIDTSGWGEMNLTTKKSDVNVRPGDEERTSANIYNMIRAAKVSTGSGETTQEMGGLRNVDWSVFDIPEITTGDVLDAKLERIANLEPVDVNRDGVVNAFDVQADAEDGTVDGKQMADLRRKFGGYGPMAGGLAPRRSVRAKPTTKPTVTTPSPERELATWDLSDLGPAPDPKNLPIPPDVARRNERRARTAEFAKGVIADVRDMRAQNIDPTSGTVRNLPSTMKRKEQEFIKSKLRSIRGG